MAPIRRAKGYVTYVVAMLITGLFGLFHKAPPVWADEIKADHSAQVFSNMIKVAKNENWTEKYQKGHSVTVGKETTVKPGGERAVFPEPTPPTKPGGERAVFPEPTPPTKPGGERAVFPEPTPPTSGDVRAPYTWNTRVYNSVNDALKAVYLKIEKGDESLTAEESALIMSAETANQYKDIQNQMNVLMMMIKDLQEKAAK